MGAKEAYARERKNTEEIPSFINKISNDISEVKQNRIKEGKGMNDLIKIDINLHTVIKSVCKIQTNTGIGTGFLIKLYKDNKDFFCLTTCEHVVTKEKVKAKEAIIIYYDGQNERREIELNSKDRYIREYHSKKDLDIIIIEILKRDNIDKKYFLLPYIGSYDELINKKIYIVQFPEGQLSYSGGELLKIDKYEITYNVSTSSGSSGSPIFLENTTKVIGIHKSTNKLDNENFGDFIYPIVEEDKKFVHKTINYYFLGIGYGDIRTYDGEYYDGKPGGFGTMYFLNGSKFIGEFKNGSPHGKGILYDHNGNIIYDGEFANGFREGNGKFYLKCGQYYIGEFKNGLYNGKGKIYHKNGKIIYEGDFVNNKLEGNGKHYDEDGSYYIGEFKNGFHHGRGKIYKPNGNILYDGDFINDKFEGNGKYIWEDGSYFIGEFKNGFPHGKGIKYDKNGTVLKEGNFIEGEFEDK